MITKLIKIDTDNIRENELEEAASILSNDGLVAFPTETVYGLGANGMHPDASKKIYEAKGRPSDNPLILHIADVKALDELTSRVSEEGKKLAEAFWPGPLTLIFDKSEAVPYGTTGGLDTVAIRMPSHPIAYELIKQSKVYVAAPSANISGRPSPTKAKHVMEDLEGRIDMVIDGGNVEIGLESTIVDVSGEIPTILRPGYITLEQLQDVVGSVVYDPAVLKTTASTNIVAKAPGMKYKHYAPKGELTIYQGETSKVVSKINELVDIKQKDGYTVGVISTDETRALYPSGVIKSIGSRKDEDSIARGLFDILREFDKDGVQFIYSESFQNGRLGQAIMNRLLKAAGYHIEIL